jgi:hypothetical protein
LLFSTDVCGLEAMLNSFHVDNVVATSESELEDELVSISGQLPSELAAQIPSVVVENSSDIHIGPRLQYNGPVTVKQYITVKAKDDIDSSSGVPSNDASATHLQQPEVVDPLGMYTRVFKICLKGEGIAAPVHTVKAYRENGGISPLILNTSSGWMSVISFTPRSLYGWGKN